MYEMAVSMTMTMPSDWLESEPLRRWTTFAKYFLWFKFGTINGRDGIEIGLVVLLRISSSINNRDLGNGLHEITEQPLFKQWLWWCLTGKAWLATILIVPMVQRLNVCRWYFDFILRVLLRELDHKNVSRFLSSNMHEPNKPSGKERGKLIPTNVLQRERMMMELLVAFSRFSWQRRDGQEWKITVAPSFGFVEESYLADGEWNLWKEFLLRHTENSFSQLMLGDEVNIEPPRV